MRAPVVPAPAECLSVVRDEWIDENDHLNSAMYFVAFRQAASVLFRSLGLDSAYVASSGHSLVQREAHIRYVRELRRGHPLRMCAWVAGIDRRSVHVVGELQHGDEGWTAATVELLYTSFDRRARRSIDWPQALAERLREFQQAGADTLPTDSMGRRIAVRPE